MAKDLFSRQTSAYAKYRPVYPQELYDHILSFVQKKKSVWDCGAGNGQAATKLAEYFEKVKATDISEKQLLMAPPHPNIEYVVAPAEHTPFPDNTFDLVTVAQAYHWFNFEDFAKEVRRVTKPGGVIAIWGYNLITTQNAALNSTTKNFYTNVVGPYWDPERKYVEQNYETVPFNFPLLSSKMFVIESSWLKADLTGYLNSWSAVQHFITAKNYNPVDALAEELDTILSDDESIPISFPVFLKLGTIS